MQGAFIIFKIGHLIEVFCKEFAFFGFIRLLMKAIYEEDKHCHFWQTIHSLIQSRSLALLVDDIVLVLKTRPGQRNGGWAENYQHRWMFQHMNLLVDMILLLRSKILWQHEYLDEKVTNFLHLKIINLLPFCCL